MPQRISEYWGERRPTFWEACAYVAAQLIMSDLGAVVDRDMSRPRDVPPDMNPDGTCDVPGCRAWWIYVVRPSGELDMWDVWMQDGEVYGEH